jgi:hypothetical protein
LADKGAQETATGAAVQAVQDNDAATTVVYLRPAADAMRRVSDDLAPETVLSVHAQEAAVAFDQAGTDAANGDFVTARTDLERVSKLIDTIGAALSSVTFCP